MGKILKVIGWMFSIYFALLIMSGIAVLITDIRNGEFVVGEVIAMCVLVLLCYGSIKLIEKGDKLIAQKNGANVEAKVDITIQKNKSYDNNFITMPEDLIDDITFIKNISFKKGEHAYIFDVILDSRPYGWTEMIKMAEVISEKDIASVDLLGWAEYLGADLNSVIEEYDKVGGKVSLIQQLKTERGVLVIAGKSKRIGNCMIELINQTCTLRVHSFTASQDRVERYVETLARNNFDKPDDMKHAKSKEHILF